MTNHAEINTRIQQRALSPGKDEETYSNMYDFVCENSADPHILFKLSIYSYYMRKYRWTQQEADQFISDHLDNSIKWSEGENEYFYDWGRGCNKVTDSWMHRPNLDHIIPREQGGSDKPDNMRIRCRRLNINKSNTNSDRERMATIVDHVNDLECLSVTDREKLVKLIGNFVKKNTV